MKGGVLVVAVMVDGSKCILTNLDDCRSSAQLDMKLAQKRAGLMILGDEGATHPAERLILSAWVGANVEAIQKLSLPKQNGINVIARILKDEDARFKVWRAEFEPEAVRFELVARTGVVQRHTVKLKLFREYFINELRMVAQEEPEVVLRYSRRPGDEVWVGLEIAGIIMVELGKKTRHSSC